MARPKRDMPWLDQRDNGVFYVHWYDADARRTRQRSLGTTDGADAQIAYAQFLLNGRTVYEPEDAESPTVVACLDHYIREHAERNCADPDRQIAAGRNLKEFFRDTLMADVDIRMSRDYAAARIAGKIGTGSKRGRGSKVGSPSTIRRELNVLVAAANHAVKWKRLSKAQLPSVELPPHAASETPWYTKPELARLIAAATDERLKRFIRIAYYTGARRESIEKLSVKQIDFNSKTINLQKVGERKTVKRRPVVPLYQAIVPDVVYLIGESSNGLLFDSYDFYRPFRKLCESEAVGLAHKAHPHILRHTRATHLLLDGVSIYDVAKLLGDTVRTVESTYGHACSDQLAKNTGDE